MTATQAGVEHGDVTIWQVKYGERTVRKSDVYHDFASYGEPDAELEMDYSFWVIWSGGEVILFDTGYDIAKHDWLGEISTTPPPDGLKTIGLDPTSVDTVIVSHYHYDHIGYLGLFENATIVASAAEHEYWFGKRRRGEMAGEFAAQDDLDQIEAAANAKRLQLVTGPTQLRDGITAYPVGGHCPGEMLLSVDTSSGPVLLAADAAHFLEQVERNRPFFAFHDLDDMKSGLQFIADLAQMTGARVIPGHDSRVRAEYPAAPGEAGTVATVLA